MKRLAQGGTEYSPLGGAVPTLDDKEAGCFNWWTFSFPTQHFEIIETLSRNMYCENTSYGFNTYHYEYTWLAMDMTDNDEDGVLDYMERQGILGTNHHIYYSSTQSSDGDGDGLTDSQELGVRYIISRDESGVLRIYIGNSKVYESMDGTISPDSQYYLLYNYFEGINCGETRVLSVIQSDAQKLDSDGDDSYDAIDAYPTRENPLINYIILGEENGDTTLYRSSKVYEMWFNIFDMEYCTIRINSVDAFRLFWNNMKKIKIDDNGVCFSEYDYYRGVDNLIIICHGTKSGATVLRPADTNGEEEILMAVDYFNIVSDSIIHINVVDFCSCYSGVGAIAANPAVITVAHGNIDRTYGYDGPALVCNPIYGLCGHLHSNCEGYYCFNRYNQNQEYNSYDEIVAYEELEPDYYWYDSPEGQIDYYYPIHSLDSAGS